MTHSGVNRYLVRGTGFDMLCTLTALAGLLVFNSCSTSSGETITLDFAMESGGPFDNAGVGAFLEKTEGSKTVRLSTVAVKAPSYVIDQNAMTATWDGVSYKDATTRVSSTSRGIGVIHPDFAPQDSATGFTFPWGGGHKYDYREINPGEYWEAEFDADVVISEMDFTSLNNSESIAILIEGDASPTVLHASLNIVDFPLGSRVIPAGVNIRFTGGAEASSMIKSISVEVQTIPEPAALGMACLVALLLPAYTSRRA